MRLCRTSYGIFRIVTCILKTYSGFWSLSFERFFGGEKMAGVGEDGGGEEVS